MKKIIFFILFIIMCFTIVAQNNSNFQSTNNTSAYMFSGSIAGSENLKIKTYIWGQIKKPGLYIVPDNTDLLALISLAGGPTEDAKLSKVKIVRPTAEGDRIIEVNMRKYMESGDEKLIPKLEPGDTIIVSGTIYYAFRRGVRFLADVSMVFGVYNLFTGN